jgi:hypothetical protein
MMGSSERSVFDRAERRRRVRTESSSDVVSGSGERSRVGESDERAKCESEDVIGGIKVVFGQKAHTGISGHVALDRVV